MTTHILFLQGAGEGAHKADKLLVSSLEKALGKGYEVHYPKILNDGNASYDQWKTQITKELQSLAGPIVLVGHSMGASIFAKYLSETTPEKIIKGVFLIASPFWGGAGWLYDGYQELELPVGVVGTLPKDMPVFLYHCRDDEIVPYEHMTLYAKALPQAKTRTINRGGHQFDNDLAMVAKDILEI